MTFNAWEILTPLSPHTPAPPPHTHTLRLAQAEIEILPVFDSLLGAGGSWTQAVSKNYEAAYFQPLKTFFFHYIIITWYLLVELHGVDAVGGPKSSRPGCKSFLCTGYVSLVKLLIL